MDILFPLKGYHKGHGAERQPPGTTPFIQNMRPINTQDKRVGVGGQRGGLKKAYAQQISGTVMPVVEMIQITTVD